MQDPVYLFILPFLVQDNQHSKSLPLKHKKTCTAAGSYI